jgi:hypothetical protein
MVFYREVLKLTGEPAAGIQPGVGPRDALSAVGVFGESSKLVEFGEGSKRVEWHGFSEMART